MAFDNGKQSGANQVPASANQMNQLLNMSNSALTPLPNEGEGSEENGNEATGTGNIFIPSGLLQPSRVLNGEDVVSHTHSEYVQGEKGKSDSLKILIYEI